ncbi:ABC transporter ATP-binding protein [Methylobacterium isbiliense]|jgi:iron complex transport system ATP-binding protein|uniref:Iron(3+)-hydroxamate import ATP-binding protein FhuC n=1 Tax=Methylobacterium isbiliense TaxID=315478 RepID=A0ABQ4SM64_9HYPH|nr:ABC transporter ATP-binding protein [Methylobacterium isbiliense]MDN3623943.1 ABC transporter ATP-binding protein [Methylobacterium isbiliense]GJE02796.1 Iron(3+)-hydroxamate import ATP-binding protein FhuC [Methylobacterium isbiliense]
MSLAARNIRVRLGGRTVLSDVSLALEPGRFVGLVGPNGAGKTTLLRALSALVAPTEGRITFDGRSIADISRDERARRIAALFQGAGVGWPMTVREIVALGRLPHRRAFASLSEADEDAIARAMVRTDIGPLADRTEPTLSSGERMRALLARALAVEAEWLLVDEPVTALDPAHQLDAMVLLRQVSRDGAGVVAVLHDLGLAARFCDRLVVLHGGRLVADGHPDEALTDELLAAVFGVTACRGQAPDGTRYILPWARCGMAQEESDGAITTP